MSESLTPHRPPTDVSRHLAVAPQVNGPGYPDEAEGSVIAEYLGALRRHLWLVLLVGVVGLGLAAFAVSRTERLYSSKAVLQLSDERATPTGGLAGLAATLGGGGGSLQSQLEVLRSRLVLGQVVDSLGLRLQRRVPGVVRSTFEPTGLVDQVQVADDATATSLDLAFTESGVRVRSGSTERTARYGEPVSVDGVRFVVPVRPEAEEITLHVVSRNQAVNNLLERVRAYPKEGTNVVDIFATGYDPAITERTANATARVFQRFSGKRTRAQAERRREFVANQLAVAESLLTTIQNDLTEFRQNEELYSSKAKAMMEQNSAGELELRRAELEAQRRFYSGLLAELERPGRRSRAEVLRTIVSSPGIVTNPMVMALYDQLSRYEASRDSLLAGPRGSAASNPDVQRLDSLSSTVEARLTLAVRSHAEALEAQVTALNDIKGRTDAALSRIAATEPVELRLMLRMESVSEAAKELRERYYTAGMAEAAEMDQITVLDRALPGDPAGSGPFRSLVFGLVFGLMVGGAGAVVLDGANRSIRRRDEMEHLLRVPGLAVIPELGNGAKWSPLRLPAQARNGNGNGAGSGRALVAGSRANPMGAEAYRTLRTNLIFSQVAQGLRSIVVTSASAGDGKTTTVANLGVAFAQQGMRVLLIDCDFRRPGLHPLFGVPREPGLAQLLLGEATVEQVVRRTSTERLSVIPAGRYGAPSATDVLGGGVVATLLDALAEEFDLVILDTPPVLVTANAAILSTQVDGVLMVVRAGQTDRDQAREAVQQITVVGGRVLGSVLNGAEVAASRHKAYFDEETAAAQA
jgi:tyrosine-protein kinase Etk/Wzc